MPLSPESPSTAVDRAITILEAAAERRDGLTNSEISRKLAIPKSSASYILRTLERRGFVRRDRETGRYRLGLKVLSLGRDVLASLNIGEMGLKKRTPRTIISQGRFFAELERVRAHGYAVDDEENSLGARCVAAPVFDMLGCVEFALGVSGTVSQMDDDTLPRIAEHLKDTARRISRQIRRVGPGGSG